MIRHVLFGSIVCMGLQVYAQIPQTKVVGWGSNYLDKINIPAGLNSAVDIAAGSNHALALLANGSIVGWGDNYWGQKNIPTGLSSVVGITAGGNFSLALLANGSVVGWGANNAGQINIPPGLSSVIGISAGSSHSMALLANGTVRAWGDNGHGKSDVPIGLSSVVGIAAGGQHSMALLSNGTIVAWGDNSVGQLDIPSGLGSVVGIAAGGSHSMALLANGTVRVWGYNAHGITNVPVGLSSVVGIFSGSAHCVAIQSNGSVVAWGRNLFGETVVPNDLGHTIKIAAGTDFTIALVRLKNQTIAGFNAIPNQITDFAPIMIPVTATSGLPINYLVVNTITYSAFNFTSNALTFNSLVANDLITENLNPIVIIASQQGNNTYAAAQNVSHVFTVSKKMQTITGFNPIPHLLTDFAPITFPTTATSGLPISYQVTNTLTSHNFYLASDATLRFSDLLANGLIQDDSNPIAIRATQMGNFSFAAASPIEYTFTVSKKLQSIPDFNLSPTYAFGSTPKALPGFTSGMLPIHYTVQGEGAILSNNTLYFVGEGVSTVTGQQFGDNVYKKAEDNVFIITITGFSQTLIDRVTSLIGNNTSGANTTITSVVTVSSGLSQEEVNDLIQQALQSALTKATEPSAANASFVRIYPNPSSTGKFKVEGLSSSATIEIYSAQGIRQSFEYDEGLLILTPAIQGIYQVMISDKGKTHRYKLWVP